MRCAVTITFDANKTLDLSVETNTSKELAIQAQDWFEQRWVELECEPARTSGKTLILDKILGVTEETGYTNLVTNKELADELALKAAQALEKPIITINLIDQTISF